MELDEVKTTVAFIRRFLARCAISPNEAKQTGCVLARRISLLKGYADRGVAHLTLHNYEFDIADVMHVAAATAILGAVINQFDNPQGWPPSYFEKGDLIAFEAARAVFPILSKIHPIFQGFDGVQLIKQVSLGTFRPGEEYLSAFLSGALGLEGISLQTAKDLAQAFK